MNDSFVEFIENLKVSNMSDIETSLNDIAKKLNQKYYNDSSSDNYLLVGSMGRNTSIKGESDIDVIYELPDDVFKRFDSYKFNGQSQLLNEIKEILKEKYSSTDIRSDGQVVVIPFKKYKIELVPGFKQEDASYKYPDTHDGGSWKITKPIPEINESINMIDNTYTYKDICQMLRAWKSNNGVTICGLLIDTLIKNFLDENVNFKYKNKDEYCDLMIEVFKYLSNQNDDRKQWFALGSNQIIENKNFNFIKKAKKAYEKLYDNSDDLSVLREIFGNKFPISERTLKECGFSGSEQYIEDLFPVYIIGTLKIDCNIIQNGYRTSLLSDIIKKRYKIKQNGKLSFFIDNCSIKKPYDIYWKIRNVGKEAVERNCIRGQINKGKEMQNETSNFYGPHFVECYIIKNKICVARDRMSVPIDVN